MNKICRLFFVLLLAFHCTAFSQEGTVHEETQEEIVEQKEQEASLLSKVNGFLVKFLFADVLFGKGKNTYVDELGNRVTEVVGLPLIVVTLLFGGIFFSIVYRFINIRGFRHSIEIIRGKYDNKADEGEISHFRALTSALSATVGLGNIASVAVAIQIGGPGAVFWMIVTAFFGMTMKFSSCTLSQLYRKRNPDGSISGGPMYYLDIGLKEKGKTWGAVGKFLGFAFAFFAIGGAIGGGNMFQVNQVVETVITTFKIDSGADISLGLGSVKATPFGIGVVMSVLVGVVVLGGIKRIGAATSRIVPFMVGIYVITAIFIIFSNITKVPQTISLIISMAFTDNALYGGFLGVMVNGIKRASFSNEAGLGSAAIAHAAAKTEEPVREGIVAMIGPFIDTIIVCTITALVVIITGAWNDPSISREAGSELTIKAFGSALPWFPYVLTGCICLFAYSTMISWCYYGERAWIYLLDHLGGGTGIATLTIYRVFFISFIIVGAVNSLADVLLFTDLLILSMAYPNILGSIILVPKILPKVRDYWQRYTSGAFEKNT